MLDLEVHPGQSISTEKWEFVLGMHISQAIAITQTLVTSIHKLQLLYSKTNPLETDICLKLTQDGIQLHFDPISQRLKTIEVFSMKSLKLRYCDSYFNSSEILPTIEQIDSSFGATHPGTYNDRQELAINFPGLSFYFYVDIKSQPYLKKDTRYLQFPAGLSPMVTNMLIFHGTNTDEAMAPTMPSSCMHNMIFLDSLQVLRKDNKTRGLRLDLYMDDGRQNNGKKSFTTDIMFGASCQVVSSRLGAPSRVFYKSVDKMKIHNAQTRKTMTRSDFFFNYFTLGFDVLFDARTQRVKKFVLHTNFPGHYDFNTYHRCNFELPITCPIHPKDRSHLIEQEPLDLIVRSTTKWGVLLNRIKPRGRPVVLHRSSSTNTTNPFGSTFCHGYQDLIFEVMNNDHIATITLYEIEDMA